MNALASRVQRLTQATDFWNGWMLWSLVAVTIVAGLVAITTRLVIVRTGQLAQAQDDLNKAKEAQLALDLKSKDLKIGELGTQAAGANARIAEAERGSAEANALAKEAQASLALAEQHSAEANAKAEGFKLDIAQANKSAAEANRIAEQERLARLQLEARLADRTLLPIQEQNLEKAFASLNGKTVDVAVIGDTVEIAQFSGKIIDCMRRSGVLLKISRPIGGASARGVLVGVKADAPPEFKQSADALVAILQQTVGGGVGQWDFEKLVSGGAAMVSVDKGAEPNSPLRVWIGSK